MKQWYIYFCFLVIHLVFFIIIQSKITATGFFRKATGIAGIRSSIPTRNLLDFFPVDSSQFPVLFGRNRPKIIRKNLKNFRWECCFHVQAISDTFLLKPVRSFSSGNILLTPEVSKASSKVECFLLTFAFTCVSFLIGFVRRRI